MATSEPLHFRLDVNHESAPISGEMALDGVPSRSFAGWTELFVALNGAIAEVQQAAEIAVNKPEEYS